MELSYDLHIHSCLSPCGDDEMTPWNLVGMAKVLGLDAVALITIRRAICRRPWLPDRNTG